MVSRVLVAMDGSEMAEKALRYAFDAYPDVEITVLTVVGVPTGMFGQATAIALADDPGQSVKDRAKPVLERAQTLAEERDREVTTEARTGHPARAILNRASDFDTVVVGSHGGSLADRLLVGNVAERVFRQSPVPVVVVR